MRAGLLRRRLVVQSRAAGVDPLGQPLDVWTTVASVWGAVDEPSPDELARSGVVSSQTAATVRTRWRSDLTGELRVVDGSRVWEVDGPPVDPDGRRREMHLRVREVTP